MSYCDEQCGSDTDDAPDDDLEDTMMMVVMLTFMRLWYDESHDDDDDYDDDDAYDDDGGDGYDDGDEYAKYAHDRGSEIFDDDFSNSTIQIPRMAMTVP